MSYHLDSDPYLIEACNEGLPGVVSTLRLERSLHGKKMVLWVLGVALLAALMVLSFTALVQGNRRLLFIGANPHTIVGASPYTISRPEWGHAPMTLGVLPP